MLCIPIAFQHNIIVRITQHYHSIRWIAGLSTTLLLDCQQHDCWYWCLDTIWNQHFSGLMHSLTLNNPHMVAGWWFGTWLLYFSIQLGMSSSQLTFTPSFFRGVGQLVNHQPGWTSHDISIPTSNPGAARDDRWSRPRRGRRGERGPEPFFGCHRICRPLFGHGKR